MVVIGIKYVIYSVMSKEVVITDKIVVSCNGDDRKGSNHPKVWLKIKETEKFVDCPYCERRFLYEPSKS